MLNFVPVFGNVHLVAFTVIKEHFHVSFQSSRFFQVFLEEVTFCSRAIC